MKTRTFHRQRGFTLIELLVVIAIIAVLAAAGFSGGVMAINKAKKTTSEAAAHAIVTAVNNYYQENGSLPVPQGGGASVDGGSKFDTSSQDGVKVLNILCGFEDEINTRKVRYLQAREGKNKKNGLIYTASGNEVTGMFDPWGNPYIVVMDTNYEERIKVKPGTAETTLNGRRCAVYSVGADKKGGTADDVKTW